MRITLDGTKRLKCVHKKVRKTFENQGCKLALLFVGILYIQLFFSGKSWFPDIIEWILDIFVSLVALATIEVQLLDLRFKSFIGHRIFCFLQIFMVVIPMFGFAGYFICFKFSVVNDYLNQCSACLGVSSYFLFLVAQSKRRKQITT